MASSAPHPSTFVPSEVLDTIRKHSQKAEQNGDLHPAQLGLIYDHLWFKMFVPKEFGGLALSLPDVLKTEEALAWADGSVGWVVTLCSGAGWFVGFLDREVSTKIFYDEKLCLAGSGAATGTAEITRDGYIVNGRWKYASGALHATMFTANCVITKNGKPNVGKEGNPEVIAFLLTPDEVEIERNWTSMGMVATGSHGFVAKNVRIPANRAFQINSNYATLSDPVYAYPFLQLAEVTLAVNISGMACQFLDLCEPVLRHRSKTVSKLDLLKLLGERQEELNQLRFKFYDVVDRSWNYCLQHLRLNEGLANEVSGASRKLYESSIWAVQNVYPFAGLVAADINTEINRVWRNIHTASQHTLFTLR